ncbi:MAG TPA: hypothetical protein VG028_21235 [Terriglobia bacterium]|nr:hypothetical protein [Terriglobia bacterium]
MVNPRTDGRLDKLRRYCEQDAKIDPRNFHCKYYGECKSSVSTGLTFIPGGLAHVGEDYDVTLGDQDLRIMFVGYDYGNGSDCLENRRTAIQEYAGHLNPHYRGIVKVMMEIFQVGCDSEGEGHVWRPLLRKMAQTNATRCCASRNGAMRTNTTREMQQNCWGHFRKEIEILEPTIIFFHGARLRQSLMQNLQRGEPNQAPPTALSQQVGHHCQLIEWTAFSRKFTSALLFFNHPAFGHFGNQWEAKVVPALELLREHSLLPAGGKEWRARGRAKWPPI